MQNHTKNLEEQLELHKLPDAVKGDFLSEVGEVVLDSALIRAAAEMSEEQATALTYYLKSDPTPGEVFSYLVQRCKGFSEIIEEEMHAFQENVSGLLAAVDGGADSVSVAS